MNINYEKFKSTEAGCRPAAGWTEFISESTLNCSFSPHFIPGTSDGLEIQLCPEVNQKMFKYADTDFTTYLTSSNDAILVPTLIMAQQPHSV